MDWTFGLKLVVVAAFGLFFGAIGAGCWSQWNAPIFGLVSFIVLCLSFGYLVCYGLAIKADSVIGALFAIVAGLCLSVGLFSLLVYGGGIPYLSENEAFRNFCGGGIIFMFVAGGSSAAIDVIIIVVHR